jgi:hypothetical protein
MNARDEITVKFQELAEGNLPVKLINAYRGIPIAYTARIIRVEKGNVTFSVNEYQAVCLTLEGKTHIHGERLPEVYRATTVAVDIPQKEATLTEFVGTGRSLGNRLYTRVQPKEPIDVILQVGEHSFAGYLADVSLSGVGVFTLGTYAYGDLDITKGSKAQISFKLPPTHSLIKLQGQITSVVSQPNTAQHRLGLKTLPGSAVEPILLEYVAYRRDELMRELSMIYDTMQREQMKVGKPT